MKGFKYVVAGFVAITAFGILGGLAWLYFSAPSPTVLDSITGCPQNGPTAATFVLVDLTDPLPIVSQIQMEDHLQAMATTTAKGALLEVLALDANDSNGTVRFSRCSPGDGSDESATTGNPEKSKRRYEREFLEPFSAMVKGGLTSMPADQSPILETLQALAVGKISKIHRKDISVEPSDCFRHATALRTILTLRQVARL